MIKMNYKKFLAFGLMFILTACAKPDKKIEIYGITVDSTKFEEIKNLYNDIKCKKDSILSNYKSCYVMAVKSIEGATLLDMQINQEGEVSRLTIVINKEKQDYTNLFNKLIEKFGEDVKDNLTDKRQLWVANNGNLILSKNLDGDILLKVEGKKFQADWKNHLNLQEKSRKL